MHKTVLMIGSFDTKGTEYAFLRNQLMERGHRVLAVDVGVLGSTDLFPVDISADEVATAAGASLAELRQRGDRGEAVRVMVEGAPRIVSHLHASGRFDGIIGMGGTAGTSVVTAAMRALPIGTPKLCISTAASGDTSAYVGTKDVVMFPSIVDIAGINRISGVILSRAAGAIGGMVEAELPVLESEKPIITASMFGNTTECVTACVAALAQQGYETLVFHATGIGGKALESLVAAGLVDAVLDITTTELADTLCGGIFDAGPERLDAAGRMGVPHLIVPGCLDMVNFGAVSTVPQKYRDGNRVFYEWNPATTLMRTNAQENAELGRLMATKANAATGPVAFLLPLRGISVLDGDGQPFCDREADSALFEAIKTHVRSDIPVIELDNNINDPEFSAAAVTTILDLIESARARSERDNS